MSKKRLYHATYIKDINVSKLNQAVAEKRVVLGVDIGKEEIFGVFMNEQQDVIQTIKWKSPHDTLELIGMLEKMPATAIEVAMEPTGTYGDALLDLLLRKGIAVYQINPRRTHDALEVYDGVPSSHDAKSAAIVAKLHLDGLTNPWVLQTDHERDISAAFETVELYKRDLQAYVSRLEAKLARYWPEITGYVSLTSATLLTLLETFGSPQEIASNSKEAHQLMARVAGPFLSLEKREAMIRSAAQTIGVSMLKSESKVVQGIAAEMQRLRSLISKAEAELKKITQADQPVSNIGKVVGVISASAIFVLLGDPNQYESAKAYEKAFGLNLIIHQSGKHIGEVKISKRGPGRARHYLYYATLRLIQQNELFKAWYSKKIRRLGEKMKGKAIVALMRKLAQSLWHVGCGATFDSSKLLDARRLNLAVG